MEPSLSLDVICEFRIALATELHYGPSIEHAFLYRKLTSPVPPGQHTNSTSTPASVKYPFSLLMCNGVEKCSGTDNISIIDVSLAIQGALHEG